MKSDVIFRIRANFYHVLGDGVCGSEESLREVLPLLIVLLCLMILHNKKKHEMYHLQEFLLDSKVVIGDHKYRDSLLETLGECSLRILRNEGPQ
jgi:hypothetical protein